MKDNNPKSTVAVKKALQYYAPFKHPLKLHEIHYNCGVKCSVENVKEALILLLKNNVVCQHKNYYSISNNIHEWIDRRKKGERNAKKLLPSALRYGRFIAFFPFVRFVGLSGSLSKGYSDEKSDLDYFIITKKNRLWICRSILHLMKKVSFLFSLQHKFCMNYFVDEDHCEIEEKNLYTAIELSSLKAVAGKKHYQKLMQENQWRFNFLPNYYKAFFESEKIDNANFVIKQLIEWLIDPIGEKLNSFLMLLTDRKWRKKWKARNYPSDEYELAFKTTLYHSKNHPANYQKKVLSNMETDYTFIQ